MTQKKGLTYILYCVNVFLPQKTKHERWSTRLNNTTKEIKIQVLKDYIPEWSDIVKIRYEGSRFMTIKAQTSETKTHIKRLDKGRYIVLSTNEVKNYEPQDKDKQKISRRASLNRSFDELQAMLRTNFDNHKNHTQVFITLTYRENMRDEKKLYKDFRDFMGRLETAYKRLTPFVYIAVMEPQGRGAWHVHLCLKSETEKNFYIPQERLKEIWRNGGAHVAALKGEDVGAYYRSYFTGLYAEAEGKDADAIHAYEQAGAEMDKILGSNEMTKKRAKGERLNLYPKHFRFYRCSRNVKRPGDGFTMYETVDNDPHYKKVYDRAVEIEEWQGAEKTGSLTKIYKATYKLKERCADDGQC
jgi:hypothetical protein